MVDCINKVEKLIDRAVELNLKGLALTDHETISGHVRALQYVEEGKNKGKIPKDFKLILGNEIYLTNAPSNIIKDQYKPGDGKLFYHFILLAKDEIGHRQLRELSSIAWEDSFYTGRMERTPLYKKYLEEIISKNPGHLIGSTACLGGELDQLLLQLEASEENKKNYYKAKIEQFLLWGKQLFGEGNFFLEMQPTNSSEQMIVNKYIPILSEVYDIDYIITTDAHYLSKDQKEIHEVYLKSHEEEREVSDFYETTYLMEENEIYNYLDYLDQGIINKAFENSCKIGSKIQEYDLYHSTIVPASFIPDFNVRHLFKEYYDKYPAIKFFAYSENKYDRYLLYLIEKGYKEKFIDSCKERRHTTKEERLERINIELEEIDKVTQKINTSISAYYISTLELIDIMWNEGDSLVGVSRGSVTGMFTMYLIGLMQMNPLDWGLPHWRHISHEKAELSDVDVDSEASKRTKIIEAVKKRKGERKVLNACTFKTEGSKSAVITACRALDVDPDMSAYIAGMIPIVRGKTWTLTDCLEGNIEDEKAPIPEFIKEMESVPLLLEVAKKIEGLVCGRSIHASAVYIFNEDFTAHNARMKAPNGTYITQFNMADSDYCGGLKMDFLTIEALDKIRNCMNLLLQSGHMEWQGTLRDTYDKYLHPDVLDYDTKEMWDWVAEGKVIDLFQFQTMVGIQAAKRIKPHSLEEMAAANSIMRLMVTEEGAEQPIDTYIRFKDDISQWYKLMREDYHLTEDEIHTVEPYLKSVYGVGDTQEIVMEISMDGNISDFNVAESNKLRKGIAKKKVELQKTMKEFFFKRGKEIGTSDNLLNYIWKEVVGKQLGYSFSKNHTFPYSAIGLQELNLAYHYPIIYWNTACLTVNAGADENDAKNKSTDYGKVATAIADIQKRGVKISLPLINEAGFSFIPDEKSNRIIFSLKGLVGIGDDVVHAIIQNRPYDSMEDFYIRMVDTGIIKSSQMIQLIKAGCFVHLDNYNRIQTLRDYVRRYKVNFIEKLTLSQANKIQDFIEKYTDLFVVNDEIRHSILLYNFSKYVLQKEHYIGTYIDPSKKRVPKTGYHDRLFIIDMSAMSFFDAHFSEDLIFDLNNSMYVIKEKEFKKAVNELLYPFQEYLAKESTLYAYHEALLREEESSIITGNISHMEMESLCLYTEEHELENLQEEEYCVSNFFELPEEPDIYDSYSKYIVINENGKEVKKLKVFPKYKITRIAGTVIDKNKDRHIITLLTKYGVVYVKYNKGQFLHYNKRISIKNTGESIKTVLEDSWFKRGNLLFITGYRTGDQFRCYNYADTIFKHTTNLIQKVYDDGTVQIKSNRERG